MRLGCILILYNVLLPIGLLLSLPGSFLKMRRRGGYGRGFWQRFGSYGELKSAFVGKRPFWVHAVSVGEVLIAKKLVAALRVEQPNREVVLATTTSTGHAVAREQMPDHVTVIYSPLDLPFVASRALRTFQPAAIICVEAEVWPNFICSAHDRGIPAFLANARLSPRSAGRYRKFRGLVSPIFQLLERVFVQDPEDVEKWRGLGVEDRRIMVAGSVKFDEEGVAEPSEVGAFREMAETIWNRPLPPLVMAASTHAGEEIVLAQAFRETGERVPGLRYCIVPRHFERAADVQAELEGGGFSVVRRSQIGSVSAGVDPDVFLIDSTGEMSAWQYLPDVVVIGKSFLAEGGQNPVEAILAGKPVVCGPEMQNFSVLVERLRAAGGIRQVPAIEALSEALVALFEAPAERNKQVERGVGVLETHRGATARTAAEICREFRDEKSA